MANSYLMGKKLKVLAVGSVTGLITGLFVSVAEKLFTTDKEFTGFEALLTFIPLPILAAGVSSFICTRKDLFLKMSFVAYLTLCVPLFGIGMGGANIFQQIIGGALGGIFWGVIPSIFIRK